MTEFIRRSCNSAIRFAEVRISSAPSKGRSPSFGLASPTPGLIQILVQSAVAVVEVLFLSRFGTDALAGISAVFPVVTLFVGITTVGLGGGISSAIAQSLGAGKTSEAEALAVHAVLLAIFFGVISAAALIGFGPEIYRALGAKEASLDLAVSYSNIVFGGSISLWLLGALTAIVRGTGDMKSPARIAILRAIVAVPLLAILIFGWGPIPGFGMVGAAIAMLVYYTLGVIGLVAHLQSSRSIIHLTAAGLGLQWQLFSRILKVAALSSAQIVVINVTLIVITAFVARFGVEALAGYGCGFPPRASDLLVGTCLWRRHHDHGRHLRRRRLGGAGAPCDARVMRLGRNIVRDAGNLRGDVGKMAHRALYER